MYQSLLCYLFESGSNFAFESSNRTVDLARHLRHSFPKHNVSFEYISSRFLVREVSRTDPDWSQLPREINGDFAVFVNDLDMWIESTKNAKLILLNTGAWWSDHLIERKNIKLLSQQENGQITPLQTHNALKMAIQTVSNHFDQLEYEKIGVFMLGPPVFHYFRQKSFKIDTNFKFPGENYAFSSFYYDVESPAWNRTGDCTWIDRPLRDTRFFPPHDERIDIIQTYFKESKLKGVLRVSESLVSRADAHVGLRPDGVMDCSHFCIPGIPDTWNEMLFAEILRKTLNLG